MREVAVEIPNVSWSDVGGLEETKRLLKEMIELPLQDPAAFTRLGIRPGRGVLLYGPPGTGKTLLARAVANECGVNFINVKGPEIMSKWVGESEKAIRQIFKKAKQVAPSIVFLDEIDAIAPPGMANDSNVTERVVNQLLTSMDGFESRERDGDGRYQPPGHCGPCATAPRTVRPHGLGPGPGRSGQKEHHSHQYQGHAAGRGGYGGRGL